MTRSSWLRRSRDADRSSERLLADGSGEGDATEDDTAEDDAVEDDTAEGDDATTEDEAAEENDDSGNIDGADQSTVEVTSAGEVDPADPKWEKPDLDDIPEVDGPKTAPADEASEGRSETDETSEDRSETDESSEAEVSSDDPTAGRPNTARSPGTSRIDEEETDAYVLAVELCARLPDDVRLPDEAADLVPVALEAELEREVQTFAAQEFGNQQPHVSELSFTDIDDEIWLRLRIGAPPEALDDLEEWTDDIETYALQKLDSLL